MFSYEASSETQRPALFVHAENYDLKLWLKNIQPLVVMRPLKSSLLTCGYVDTQSGRDKSVQ